MNDPEISVQPIIVGVVKIPRSGREIDTISTQVLRQLPDLEPDYSIAIDYSSYEELKLGRKRILTYGNRLYGTGSIATSSIENRLFVWIKNGSRKVASEISRLENDHAD